MQQGNGYSGWVVVAAASIAVVAGMALATLSFDAGRAAAMVREQSPAERAASAGHLTLKSMSIQNDDGTAAAGICTSPSGPALWMNAPDGKMVGITAQKGRLAVTLMGEQPEVGGKRQVLVGLLLDSGGRPVVQFESPRGEVVTIPLEKLTDR